ncbi:hypothetical protein BGW80DRAFT_1275144 [Lactifluus volemus]|nr:hypothetical protein BGW80DRAFT_1275144 [Lactifluus volemus]
MACTTRDAMIRGWVWRREPCAEVLAELPPPGSMFPTSVAHLQTRKKVSNAREEIRECFSAAAHVLGSLEDLGELQVQRKPQLLMGRPKNTLFQMSRQVDTDDANAVYNRSDPLCQTLSTTSRCIEDLVLPIRHIAAVPCALSQPYILIHYRLLPVLRVCP